VGKSIVEDGVATGFAVKEEDATSATGFNEEDGCAAIFLADDSFTGFAGKEDDVEDGVATGFAVKEEDATSATGFNEEDGSATGFDEEDGCTAIFLADDSSAACFATRGGVVLRPATESEGCVISNFLCR
jgi:hypothetical protein